MVIQLLNPLFAVFTYQSLITVVLNWRAALSMKSTLEGSENMHTKSAGEADEEPGSEEQSRGSGFVKMCIDWMRNVQVLSRVCTAAKNIVKNYWL